ncbi:MAG: hypothetical protein R2707_12535 [Acidimicrobiales bacterium]
MTEEFGPGTGPSSPDPGGVPSEWSPPSSSLPRPPSMPPPVEAVSTGPVMAPPASRPGWFGRGIALAAAAVLVGGGGYLAINAGSADGGADSPRAALDGALAALSEQDLIGAAEFVEPTERETMIDAGFSVVEELIRLEVFDDSLDLAAVDGIDVEFDDVEVRVDEVRPGVAHLFIVGGTASTALDGAAVPFGSLVTDRVDGDDLAIEQRQSSEMSPSDLPIVAVERDGRWYLSLWYTVAENARLETGRPMPASSDRLTEIGADSPEQAVENFIGAIEQLDISTMIGMLDPLEASALYDYGPLFVGDGQRAADEFLREVRSDGWTWEVAGLDLRAETDGAQATVFVDAIHVTASSDDVSFDASFTADRVEVVVDSPEVDFDYLIEDDCMILTYDEGYGPETEEMCTDDVLADAGLGDLASGAMGGLTTIDDFGIVVRNVAGRWYISPIRTGSELMLQSLRAFDAEALAETVDAFADLLSDPFALGSSFGDDTFFEIDEDMGFDAGMAFPDANAWMLADGPDYVFVYDLVDIYRDDVWWQWLTDVPEREFRDGVVGQAFLPGDAYVDIIVLAGLDVATDEELADWLGGELVTDDGFTYLSTTNSWGETLVVARTADGIAVVSSYGGLLDGVVDTLRNQVGG